MNQHSLTVVTGRFMQERPFLPPVTFQAQARFAPPPLQPQGPPPYISVCSDAYSLGDGVVWAIPKP